MGETVVVKKRNSRFLLPSLETFRLSDSPILNMSSSPPEKYSFFSNPLIVKGTEDDQSLNLNESINQMGVYLDLERGDERNKRNQTSSFFNLTKNDPRIDRTTTISNTILSLSPSRLEDDFDPRPSSAPTNRFKASFS
eukprot:GDKK01070824.1.p1 GENE.GDKK01070824.1~~GDKK01070824.1.p1  ORF type:complete len:138 (-),score=30.60 GDKK01070824.1:64-477(-)